MVRLRDLHVPQRGESGSALRVGESVRPLGTVVLGEGVAARNHCWPIRCCRRAFRQRSAL